MLIEIAKGSKVQENGSRRVPPLFTVLLVVVVDANVSTCLPLAVVIAVVLYIPSIDIIRTRVIQN
jgi:hypothetical protein